MSDLVDLGVVCRYQDCLSGPLGVSHVWARLRTALSERMQANRPVLQGGDSGNLP